MEIQGCAFSYSDAVASYQQLGEKRIWNRDIRHCVQFHPAGHPDWESSRQIGRMILCTVSEEHDHPPHQLGALLNFGSALVAEHFLDANFALQAWPA